MPLSSPISVVTDTQATPALFNTLQADAVTNWGKSATLQLTSGATSFALIPGVSVYYLKIPFYEGGLPGGWVNPRITSITGAVAEGQRILIRLETDYVSLAYDYTGGVLVDLLYNEAPIELVATDYAGTLKWAKYVRNPVRYVQNLADNGGFRFHQRSTTPTVLATVADNGFAADRWRVTRQNADIQSAIYQPGGPNYNLWGLELKKITNAGKFMLAQFYESARTVDMSTLTNTVSSKFTVSLQSSVSSMDVYIAFVRWDGAIDALPATLVSAWNAAGTIPTLTTNLVITSYRKVTITNSPQDYIHTGSLSTKNCGVIIFTDGLAAAGTSLYVRDARVGPADATIIPRRHAEDFAACQRHYQVYTPPPLRGAVGATATTAVRLGMVLPVPMFKTPTVAVGALAVSDGSASATITTLIGNYSTATVAEISANLSGSLNVGRPAHVYQGGTASMTFEAEL